MEEKKMTIADAVKAAMKYRSRSATSVAQEMGTSPSFCTRLNNDSGVHSHTIERLQRILNVEFVVNDNGWHFTPIA